MDAIPLRIFSSRGREDKQLRNFGTHGEDGLIYYTSLASSFARLALILGANVGWQIDGDYENTCE